MRWMCEREGGGGKRTKDDAGRTRNEESGKKKMGDDDDAQSTHRWMTTNVATAGWMWAYGAFPSSR